MLLAHCIGYLLLTGVLLFYNIPAIFWLVSFLVLTATAFSIGYYTVTSTILLSIVFIGLYILLAIKIVRRKFITNRFINFFKKKLPKISSTEAQAIEAGDVWWEGDIFAANINWNKVNKHKLTKLTKEEQSFLDNEVEQLCQILDAWDEVHKNKDLSQEAWEFIKKNKFLAVSLQKKYGGLEFSATAQSCIVAKIASRSIAAAVTIMVPNALGPGELLTHYGTEEQKEKYIRRLVNSEEIPCFALTSTYAGSDAGGMLDNGVVCQQEYQGKDTLGIKLNFSKRYITLAPVATLMGLAFKLFDPEGLMGTKKDLGVTLALIPTNHLGINIGRRHYAMFTPFQNGPISGKDVFIPLDFIIGGPEYIGKGWYMLMECLSGGRGISLPALSISTTQIAYLSSNAYSRIRNQFKTPIATLEGIQEQLASISGLNFISNAVNVLTTSAIDIGLKPAVVSAIAKYNLTEMSRTCINKAMDIHAGKGVMNGPNNYLINHYISSPVAITVEGANILTRNLIIFGQGAFRAHPYVLKELQALNEQDHSKSLSDFDSVLFKHIKFFIRNTVKLCWYNIKALVNFLTKIFKKERKDIYIYKKDLSKLSTALAFATDVALLFIGGKLKTNENQSARLGDVVSNLYMGISVVKYYSELAEKNKENKEYLESLKIHTRWSLEHLRFSARIALVDYINNFPLTSVKVLMSVLIKPWSLVYKQPSDKLNVQLANINSLPTGFFNNLTELCFQGDSPLGKLNKVFHDCIKLQSVLTKVERHIKLKDIQASNCLKETYQQAFDKKIIAQHEFERLKEFAEDVDSLISVDDFESLYFDDLNSFNIKKS